MSSMYLAKYAAGAEDHATVTVSVKRMKNLKIAGAQIALKNEKESVGN